jgi:MoxR-like ATPase
MMDTKAKIQGLLNHLLSGLYEREEAVKLSLLAAVAGESVFLLGPPGVGKSLVARRLKYAFKDGKSFEYLMTRFSTPDEVFGPVSIKKLKEEDKYERLTEKFMPGANVVFLDEIWKSSSAIQNALLTILNEKVYRNGEQELPVDLKALVTASNELPPDEDSFGPLYDRLLIRYTMTGIRDKKQFLRMITDVDDVYEVNVPGDYLIGSVELEDWNKAINKVAVPDVVLSTVELIRHKIEAFNQQTGRKVPEIHLYDRRWKKVIRLLRTSAFLNNRDYIDLMDCFLMVHCLWNKPEQLPVIQEIVAETVRKHGYSLSINLSAIKKEVDEFEQEVDDEIKIKRVKTEEVLKPFDEEYYKMQKNGEYFTGNFIKVTDFNKFKAGKLEVMNIYDEEYKLTGRLKAGKDSGSHSVAVNHNSMNLTFDLITYQKEKTEVTYKAPHKLVKKFWDERYETLMHYIEKQQARMENEKPEALSELPENLFVSKDLVPLVTENLNEVLQTLDRLKMRVEKVKHAYENID